jgi:hypothetical protein
MLTVLSDKYLFSASILPNRRAFVNFFRAQKGGDQTAR